VAGVGQVSAGDGFVSGQSQADPTARLQLAGVSAPDDPHAHHPYDAADWFYSTGR